MVLSLRSAKVDCFSNTFYKVHLFGLGSTAKLGFGGVEQQYAASGSSQARPSSRHQRSEKAYQAEVCHFEVLAPHDSGVQPPFPCLRIPQITFQTAAFKSILQDHAFMDVTVFDEHGHIFWAVSAVCQASRVCPHESSIMRERHVQVDFDRGGVASAAPQWICLVDRGAAQVLVQLEYDPGQPRPPRVNAVTWHTDVGFLDEWWGSRYASRAKHKVERTDPESIDRFEPLAGHNEGTLIVRQMHDEDTIIGIQQDNGLNNPAMECVICCREILQVGYSLPCGHCQWHETCVSDWIARQNTCPLCRTPVHFGSAPPAPQKTTNTLHSATEELLGHLKLLLDDEVYRLDLRFEELQLEAASLELAAQVAVAEQDVLVDLEARRLLQRLAGAALRCGIGSHLFSALSREKAPLALEAAEVALGNFAPEEEGAVLQHAARLLDLNSSGWIEEVDFEQAMVKFSSVGIQPG
eukprot:symbB.v1.2.000618.t1/scaffold26.1/size418576/33